jgi:hypothetical protein
MSVMNFYNNCSVLELTTNANYMKLVAAINRMKEMKPLVPVPVEIVFNPTYWDYQM